MIVIISFLFMGWGSVGHKIINRKSVIFFLPSMNQFLSWRDSLAAHGSDADNRKSSDPTEQYRHYIDIDAYPEFVTNGRIAQNWDSLVALHGLTFVTTQGYVPFAIINYCDSLKKYFMQHNWRMAMLKAADVGHYLGDSHQPLHITQDYDGRSSFTNGIHSRYETSLIARDSANLICNWDSISYIPNINTFVFNILYSNYQYVDTVYRADSLAHVIAGNTNSTLYYDTFWSLCGNCTIKLFKNSSKFLAALIYTCWVNAGSPIMDIADINQYPDLYKLFQNYPNPFNPATNIKYSMKKNDNVSIKVFDIKGSEVRNLVEGYKTAGDYEIRFDGNELSSGIYFYVMKTGDYTQTKKMTLIK